MNATAEKYFLYIVLIAAILLAPALPVWFGADDIQTMAEGDTNFTNVVASGDITAGDDLSVGDDAAITGDLTVGGAFAPTGIGTFGGITNTGTLNQQGNAYDSGGTFIVADDMLVDAQADAVPLTVQGYTTPTTSLFIVEQSDGTDVWNTNSSGQNSSANGAVSFIDDVIVDGAVDTDQLTVQGYTTQTNELQVWEQYDGTDVALMSNAGALDLDSTLVYGTDNLYPLGYASANIQVECGVTATFTDTVAVTASALTTATYVIAIQITDPAATASILTVDAPAANVFNLDSWESDFTVGTTGITAYWCAVGNQ